MDLHITPEQLAFRDQVRAWLHDNVPREGLPSSGTREGFEAHRAWERRMYDAGYAGLVWPVAYGGRGADVVTQAIFEEEYLLSGAPERVNVVGHKLMAPTLMVHGTEGQKQRWLPRILSSDDVWSQGFSEPDAGSDLASLRTRAERDGDELVVNGQKIWTSYGAFADWIFALVRTDPEAGRHAGITFLAIDMRTDGVEARPIVQLDGAAGFAEVFFTDARVPVANVVGAIGDGWSVAMTTLGAERAAPAKPAGRYLRDVRELVGIARALGLGADPVVRDEIARLYVGAEAYRVSTLRTLSLLAQGKDPGHGASVTKLAWSELERDIFSTGLRLMGRAGEAIGSVPEGWWHRYWYARAATIYAGTSEIQRTIIGERILGLPR